MANQPLIIGTVNITAKDINGNSVAKQFNAVHNLNFDYNTGKVNVVDATGSFYFSLSAITTLTYTVISGIGGSHNIVVS